MTRLRNSSLPTPTFNSTTLSSSRTKCHTSCSGIGSTIAFSSSLTRRRNTRKPQKWRRNETKVHNKVRSSKIKRLEIRLEMIPLLVIWVLVRFFNKQIYIHRIKHLGSKADVGIWKIPDLERCTKS